MLLEDVISRIEQAASDLAGRVQGAAELTELVRERRLPQVTPAAFVLPIGLRGGAATAATGIFRQDVDEVVGVVLVVRNAGDATGAASLPTVDALVETIVTAIAGWAPAEQVGVFRLQRGQLVSLQAGTVIYQLDFAIADQLRIT